MRQVPDSGRSTPALSMPGAVEWPVTRTVAEGGEAVDVPRLADVGVRVGERALVEEDRVGKRPAPVREVGLVSGRVGDVDDEEGRAGSPSGAGGPEVVKR